MIKRLIALFMALLMLSGCAVSGSDLKEPVTFYYLRSHSDDRVYNDFFSEGVIGSEEREAAGHRDDLNYLLTSYFRGPLDQGLVSPFPAGCRVLEIRKEDQQMTLLLNPLLSGCTDLEITVACACLAKTCMALTGVETVRIESRNTEDKLLFYRTFNGDNLFLNDQDIPPVETAGNK